MTQNHVIVFFTLINFSGGELPVDKKCDFSSFLWVKASLVESHLLFTFPFIAFHFAFISFHFAFMSFHVPSMYQGYRFAKADMLKPVRWVSFSYRFGGLCRLPSSGFMNMYMYKLIIAFLLLSSPIVFWAGNALAVLKCEGVSQAKMKCPGLYYPM